MTVNTPNRMTQAPEPPEAWLPPSGAAAWREDYADLFHLLRQHSIRHGDFVLASGQRSTFYIDCRKTTFSGQGSYRVGRLLWPWVQSLGADAVGGMTLGADPIVTALTVTAAQAGHSLDGFVVRKAAKSHGTGQPIEGHLAPWMRIVLVEDVVTTGTSSLQALEVIQRQHPSVTVAAVLALVDRNGGGREAFEERGIPFRALFNVKQLLA